jgi:hypothetical protein
MLALGSRHISSEVVGYVASGLVLLTFTTKSMRPLRIIAILSNLAFIAYGMLDEIVPVLGLHLMLLPLNIFRLSQLALVRVPKPAKTAFLRNAHQELCVRGTGITIHGVEAAGPGRWAVTLEMGDGDPGRGGRGIREIAQLSVEVRGISGMDGSSVAETKALERVGATG